jgi:HK97 family phage major capsid protein
MKIKYLSGNKKDTVVDLDEVKAKSLVEDGLAEVVVEDDNAIEIAMKSLDAKINEAADKAATKAAAATLDKVAKGIGSQSPRIVVGPDRELLDETGGFKSESHFYLEVARSGHEGVKPTESIKRWNDIRAKQIKSTTGGDEGTAADGGIAVPVMYASNIFSMYGSVPDFTAGTFQVPMTTNAAKIPIVKNYNRANTTVTAGVVSLNTAESANVTQSKLQWEQLSLTLGKLGVMVPVSNELLEDNNVSLGAVVGSQAAYQIQKQINGGILKGSSAASNFTGIIGNAATKIVGRSTNGAINFIDVLNMSGSFAHDDADFNNACWYTSPTVLSQLGNMTSGNYNIYFPPGGAQDGTVGSLFGRPIKFTGWCPALGGTGDLILADMSKYVIGYKGGVNAMSSPHVFFLTDEMAYRFTLRNTGKPGLSTLITLEDGATTVSPFVTLGQVGGLS